MGKLIDEKVLQAYFKERFSEYTVEINGKKEIPSWGLQSDLVLTKANIWSAWWAKEVQVFVPPVHVAFVHIPEFAVQHNSSFKDALSEQ